MNWFYTKLFLKKKAYDLKRGVKHHSGKAYHFVRRMPIAGKTILTVALISILTLSASNLYFGSKSPRASAAGNYDKVYYYNSSSHAWSAYNTTNSGNILGMTRLIGTNYLVYFTSASLKRIDVSGNSEVTLTGAYSGSIGSAVAITYTGTKVYILEKNGATHVSTDNGTTWAATGFASVPVTAGNAYAIGGEEANLVVLWDGGYWSILGAGGTWVTKSLATDSGYLSAWGNPITIDLNASSDIIAIGTDKGLVVKKTVAGASFSPTQVGAGNSKYIYRSLEVNSSGYFFAAATNDSKTSTGFFTQYLSGTDSGVPLLLANIPSCSIGVSTPYAKTDPTTSFAVAIDSTTCTDPNIGTASAINNVTNNYNFQYKGVSIHTKAENITPSSSLNGSATATTGDLVKFTLTINNADATPPARPVDVKFTLPTGFTYVAGSASLAPTTGPDAGGVMNWIAYNAISGDSTITFNTTAP